MQLVSGTVTVEPLSALYVGHESWTPRWLPGRTVSTDVMVAATLAGETLRQLPPVSDPRWSGIHSGARMLGITTRDLAGILGVDCEVPDPSEPARRSSLWLPRGLIQAGRK